MTIEPRPRQWSPPTPEQRAAAQASAAAFRAEQAARRATERPLREAMAAALAEHGIVLRDPVAALDCVCGCHPRLDLAVHGGAGQAGCGCQQTPEERQAAVQRLFASPAETRPELEQLRAEEEQALAARAAELGVQVRIAVGAAPFVLAGRSTGAASTCGSGTTCGA
ncbi:hypothetical protein ACI8AC_06560 [Geodermatophilus sp. SYSU D00758]